MISPKEFLRARRPERFSDSIVTEATELDRSLLEYSLDTLTSRSQENDFARFARRLCQLEVCPNLLPQTGPTGGGDSKVDSETYPVAENLAVGWVAALSTDAARERWAFAFSAKADWRPKVKSDVAKLVATNRGYTKAFFVTNQFVPDKARAEVEDALRKKHGIDVHILDRSWIVARVFEGRHQRLVVEELHIAGLSKTTVHKGPQDAKRELALADVEKRIRLALGEGRADPALVDNALEAAELSRSLEQPRPQVQGLFARASELAARHGSQRQRVEAAYQWAWTAYWWFEDYGAFNSAYEATQGAAGGSDNIYDYERLSNLWFLLQLAAAKGVLEKEQARLDERTRVLQDALKRLGSNDQRPAAALQARAFGLQIDLVGRLHVGEPVARELRGLRRVVLDSEAFLDFPLEPLVEILTGMGNLTSDEQAYEDLFETIVKVTSNRDGQIRAARMLLTRGEQQLEQGKTTEAIASLGRALMDLSKHETRYDLVRALYLCGCAYDAIGLPWAARGALLWGAKIASADLWVYGEVTPYQAACFRRLKWIELRLGRVFGVLAWHELDMIIRDQLRQRGYLGGTDDESDFQSALGHLLLSTEFSQLKSVTLLPDVLDRLGLNIAADALLYALGHGERLAAAAIDLKEDVDDFAAKWRTMRFEPPLAPRPELGSDAKTSFSSRVLGCRIEVFSENVSPCVEVAESFLAALEGFLATGSMRHAVAREPTFLVEVRVEDSLPNYVQVQVDHPDGRPRLEIRCSRVAAEAIPLPVLEALSERIVEMVALFIGNAVAIDQAQLRKLLRDERVSERAFNFSSAFQTQAYALGRERTSLAGWLKGGETNYEVRRAEPLPLESGSGSTTVPGPWRAGKGPVPKALQDPNERKHHRTETISLIREHYWNQAGWSAALFLVEMSLAFPPVMALVFRNRDAGTRIFEELLKELGPADVEGRLRISFVRGVSRERPNAYRIVIGAAPQLPEGPDDSKESMQFFNLVARVLNVDPVVDLTNLNNFSLAQHAFGGFVLAPAFVPTDWDGREEPTVNLGLGIQLGTARDVEAADVGEHDFECVALRDEDGRRSRVRVKEQDPEAARRERNRKKRERKQRHK